MADFARGPHSEQRAAEVISYAFNDKTSRRQTRRSEGMAHGIDSLCEVNASWRLNSIQIESEPIFDAKPGSRFRAD
ncbi:hypothetical protein K9U39_15150 [Rhodoblastus acidophilus]|nr:hypothetical protein [Rhodoblastus acidophilus]